MGSSLKFFQGTLKPEGRKYLGSDVFQVSLQGGVLYMYYVYIYILQEEQSLCFLTA